MLKGESESAKEIYRLMPGLIPQPFAYGKYKTAPPVTYFFLSEFIDMDVTTAPDPVEFTSKLAELHKKKPVTKWQIWLPCRYVRRKDATYS
jgi:hypothetical protein